MGIIGKMTDEQVKLFKAAGLRINYVAPRYRNVVAFPAKPANQDYPKAA